MHFNNHAISRIESNNHDFKNQLEISTNDIRFVVKNFDILCDKQRDEYQRALDQTKQRLFHNFKKFLYRDFQIFVTLFVLRQIDEHYQKLLNVKNKNIRLLVCTSFFKRTMSLFYVYIIEKRLTNTTNDEILRLSDVYSH